MEEIKETISILKARWTEGLLILVLLCLPRLLDMFVAGALPRLRSSSMWGAFLLLKCLIYVFAYIFVYGFVRTAYLEGSKRQSFLALLRAGKDFFWRMMSLGFLAVVLILGFGYLIFLLAGRVFPLRLCPVLAGLIFIKPLLFIPPIIMVLNCRVFSSFRFLNRLKLLDAKELVVLFFVFAGLPFFSKPPLQLASVGTALDYVVAIMLVLLAELVGLVIFLGAMRFVGSAGLVHEGGANDSIPEKER